MKKLIDNLMNDRRKLYTSCLALLLLIIMLVGATYAFFKSTDTSDTDFGATVSTNTTDSLVFETGGDISFTASTANFNEGMGNQSGETFLRATLKANNKTNQASAKYFVYLDIIENGFDYSFHESGFDEDNNYYDNKNPELLLKITDSEGNVVNKLDQLDYVTVVDGNKKEQKGFDITTWNNRITIAENYEINSTGTEIQEWKFEVMFVNLDIDQQINGGKKFNAKLIIKKENSGIIQLRREDEKIWKYYGEIKNITFEPELKPHDGATYVFDLSLVQDGSVMAYMMDNGDETYTTYIQGDGKVIANENSSFYFSTFYSLESINGLEYLDTSQVTDMRWMFYECAALINVFGINNWNTSQVRDMSEMFSHCQNLTTINLSDWDTSKVAGMSSMFWKCHDLTDIVGIGNWDVSNVTNMESMFSESSIKSLDLNNWNVSKVIDMSYMFSGCTDLINLNIDLWNISRLKNMQSMFAQCASLTTLDLNVWDTSNVINMSTLFFNCIALKSLGINEWNTSQVTDMSWTFLECSSLTSLDVSSFDTSNVTDMNHMFSRCSSLTGLDVSNFDTSRVTDMSYMFSECSSLMSLDFRNAIFTGVNSHSQMFENISSTISVIVKDDAAKTFIEARLGESNGGTVTIA